MSKKRILARPRKLLPDDGSLDWIGLLKELVAFVRCNLDSSGMLILRDLRAKGCLEPDFFAPERQSLCELESLGFVVCESSVKFRLTAIGRALVEFAADPEPMTEKESDDPND